MLSKKETESILQCALKEKGDFAEIFLEDTEELQINRRQNSTTGIRSVRIKGAGLRIMEGSSSVYAYSSDTSFSALMKLAGEAGRLLKSEKGPACVDVKLTASKNESMWHTGCSSIGHDEKIRIIVEAEKAAKSDVVGLADLEIRYVDRKQRVRIANSRGVFADDERAYARMRYLVSLLHKGQEVFRWEELFKSGDIYELVKEDMYISYLKDMAERMKISASGIPVKKCRVPVVLEAGAPSTFFHECVGHMLEGNAVFERRSPFAGMIGEMIASPKLTLVDDGTLPGEVGSGRIDDEGHEKQCSVLIEKGVLKDYLLDRKHAILLGMKENGNGRRQNYMFEPACRMSNTNVCPGTDDDEEIISSIDEGLYVKTLGGGCSGAQFSVDVQDGYWIKDGKPAYPIKGTTLTGRGIDVLKKIDRVGSRMGLADSAFCGASSGLVPTTNNQPRIRISEMEIG